MLALRRPRSPFSTLTLDLQDLKPNALYEVEVRRTLERSPAKTIKGSDLAHLQLTLPDAPGSALLFYRQSR